VLLPVLAALLILASLAAIALRLEFTGTPASWAKTTGHDALWLGHAWVDERKSEREHRGARGAPAHDRDPGRTPNRGPIHDDLALEYGQTRLRSI